MLRAYKKMVGTSFGVGIVPNLPPVLKSNLGLRDGKHRIVECAAVPFGDDVRDSQVIGIIQDARVVRPGFGGYRLVGHVLFAWNAARGDQ
jgi:hypothetical protein